MKDPAGLNVVGLILLYTGLFGFIASALTMIFRGFTKEGKPVAKPLLLAFFATLGFFCCFIAGLILAG